ncbi:MAG: hypothetical protein V3V01_15225 [Acidimicrobiales bacterium]
MMLPVLGDTRPADVGSESITPRQMTLWAAGGSLVAALASLLTAFLLVSRSTTVVYGDFAVLVASALLISTVVRLGSDRMIVGEIRRAGATLGNAEEATSGQDLLASGLLLGLLSAVALILLPVDRLVQLALSEPLSRIEVALFALLVAGEVSRLVFAESLRARYRPAHAAIVGGGGRAVTLLTLAVGLTLLRGTPERTGLIAIAAIASAASSVWGATTAGQHFKWWRGRPLHSLRKHAKGHVAMTSATVSASIIGVADIWLVGAVVDAEAAARYSLAVSGVGLLGILLSASHLSLQPFLADFIGRGQPEPLERISTTYARAGLALGTIGYVGLVVAGEPFLVSIGGEAYVGIRWLIAALGVGILTGLAIGPAGACLIAGGRYVALGRVALVSATLGFLAEAAAGITFRHELAIAVFSGLAVAGLHSLALISLKRATGIRTDAFAPVAWIPLKSLLQRKEQ